MASPLSSDSHRYLPRRLAATMRRPVTWAAKSAGPAACRRTGRGWSTSTAVIVRPTTCRSRPSRTTSTSGSSGNSGFVVRQGRNRCLDFPVLRGDRAMGGLGGLLLGFLLRATGAVAVALLTHLNLCRERFLVVRAGVLDDVLRDSEGVLGGEFLETCLPVQAGAETSRSLHQRVKEQVHHVARCIEAAADVDRSDESLNRVGKDRGLVATACGHFPATEFDVLAETDRAPDLSQGTRVDHGRPQFGESTFGQVWMGTIKRVCDHDAQYRVPKELQSFVRGQSAVLVRVGTVGQGTLKNLGTKLWAAERFAQVVVRRLAHSGYRQITWRMAAREPY